MARKKAKAGAQTVSAPVAPKAKTVHAAAMKRRAPSDLAPLETVPDVLVPKGGETIDWSTSPDPWGGQGIMDHLKELPPDLRRAAEGKAVPESAQLPPEEGEGAEEGSQQPDAAAASSEPEGQPAAEGQAEPSAASAEEAGGGAAQGEEEEEEPYRPFDFEGKKVVLKLDGKDEVWDAAKAINKVQEILGREAKLTRQQQELAEQRRKLYLEQQQRLAMPTPVPTAPAVPGVGAPTGVTTASTSSLDLQQTISALEEEGLGPQARQVIAKLGGDLQMMRHELARLLQERQYEQAVRQGEQRFEQFANELAADPDYADFRQYKDSIRDWLIANPHMQADYDNERGWLRLYRQFKAENPQAAGGANGSGLAASQSEQQQAKRPLRVVRRRDTTSEPVIPMSRTSGGKGGIDDAAYYRKLHKQALETGNFDDVIEYRLKQMGLIGREE